MVQNTDEGSAAQQTFDWTKDEFGGEVTEGVKFDPEVEYSLELVSADGKIVGEKKSHMIETQWVEETSDVKIRQSFFSGRQTINVDKPERSSPAIILANALGVKVAKGDKFHIKQILKIGMKIKAHIVPQKDRKGNETGYSEIDLKTARKIGAGSKPASQITHNPADLAKWQKEIHDGVYSSKEKYLGALASTGRVAEIQPFVAACEDGKINF